MNIDYIFWDYSKRKYSSIFYAETVCSFSFLFRRPILTEQAKDSSTLHLSKRRNTIPLRQSILSLHTRFYDSIDRLDWVNMNVYFPLVNSPPRPRGENGERMNLHFELKNLNGNTIDDEGLTFMFQLNIKMKTQWQEGPFVRHVTSSKILKSIFLGKCRKVKG